MMIIPVFSIIIPVYNSECFLHACIDSLLAQTYTDFELILIDDGSTDKSGAICDEYAGKDFRIKVIHTGNQGVSVARNLGLSLAKGEYVNFVDSDDWVTPDYLEKYVEARVDYDYDLVYSEMIRMSENGVAHIIPLHEFLLKSNEDLSDAFIYLLKCGEFGYTCNKSFKREIIKLNAVFFQVDYRLHEDILFTSTYCLHIDSLRLISSAIYFYRSLTTSLTAAKLDYDIYHSATRTGCRLMEKLAEKMHSDSFNRAVGRFCQEWEQVAIVYMYLQGKDLSKKDRLNYLKEFQYRFMVPLPGLTQVKGSKKIALFGMYLKNDEILDCYFSLVAFAYKLRSKWRKLYVRR